MSNVYQPIQMYIGGEWIGTRATADVLNPATGEVLGQVPLASAAELDAALDAAARGLRSWSELPAETRAGHLLAAARLIRERTDLIATVLTLEQGKTLREARAEVLRSASILEWDANEGLRAYGRVIPGEAGVLQTVTRQPIGVVAAFTPWNFPAGSPARKIGGSLAAGCTVIIKAAEEAPGTACALVRCFADAGIPPGVVNLVFGVPADVSRHLIESHVVKLVTFTGSVPVGKHLAALAARGPKPALLELGGHSPVIVSASTDARRAAHLCADAKFKNAGQICSSPTRFIVHSSRYDEFVASFAQRARSIKVGNGLHPAVGMGPLANPRRLDAMQRMVADAVASGARLAAGGHRIGDNGYFFEPTVLCDVPREALVLNDEPFGPIAAIVPFNDLEAAIDTANGLPYGLSSYAFTESASEAMTLARRLDSGTVAINHLGGSQPNTPFGGVKESGYGREGGAESLEAYMVTKFVSHRASLV